MAYTAGKKAIGICDRCGQQFPLKKLKYESQSGRLIRLRVCTDCWDPDDPKDRPKIWMGHPEAIAVRDPRPDLATDGMNSLVGWQPVLGVELPVFPAAQGFWMSEVSTPAPRYLLTEDGVGRLAAEDGSLIWADED